MQNKIHIAVIVTCFNRCQKTLSSLGALYKSCDLHNNEHQEQVCVSVFLTDDGCTDGTSESVKSDFSEKDITILNGNGSLYWAGGMRKAWNAALQCGSRFDFYLLLNDDTICKESAISDLLEAFEETKDNDNCGIVSGVCESSDGGTVTYGGEYYTKPVIGKSLFMIPNGKPQKCLRTNANLLLVSDSVVKRIGIFDEGFVHSCADWAYGLKANNADIPVYITGQTCAVCDDDHGTVADERDKVLHMTLSQRKAFYNHPLRSTSDKLLFMRKYHKEKYILLFLARTIAIYFPSLYYYLLLKRPQKR